MLKGVEESVGVDEDLPPPPRWENVAIEMMTASFRLYQALTSCNKQPNRCTASNSDNRKVYQIVTVTGLGSFFGHGSGHVFDCISSY